MALKERINHHLWHNILRSISFKKKSCAAVWEDLVVIAEAEGCFITVSDRSNKERVTTTNHEC